VKCLIDNQLPPALSHFLASRGVEAQHVSEVGLAEATDAEIWRYVTENDLVLVSKDQDFLNFAPKSNQTKFIWVRTGNCRKPALVAAFERVWAEVEECFSRGDQVIEIR
jgi:predicted nuclease of predicted toxin-antitoxin system